ncbi:hypothetical protein ACG3SL_10010 [Sphingomonas sp. CJ20]
MSNPEPTPAPEDETTGHAHQPDGTDSSAEWDAQIADENMIPDDKSAA